MTDLTKHRSSFNPVGEMTEARSRGAYAAPVHRHDVERRRARGRDDVALVGASQSLARHDDLKLVDEVRSTLALL